MTLTYFWDVLQVRACFGMMRALVSVWGILATKNTADTDRWVYRFAEGGRWFCIWPAQPPGLNEERQNSTFGKLTVLKYFFPFENNVRNARIPWKTVHQGMLVVP